MSFLIAVKITGSQSTHKEGVRGMEERRGRRILRGGASEGCRPCFGLQIRPLQIEGQ